ncbi:hypothetical protein LTS18_006001 [Coniosporium uncinatum]|uniref:Uncharacterized protein n=1 Tax=Coniosporium uncinatum TaxID=93489 RepID=A0ACC3DCH6_9PEZI|nr:hypothetical protein LTS18_006001 [Coniosporium uncinatum]
MHRRDGKRSVAVVVKDDREGLEGRDQSVEEMRYREEQARLVERYLRGEVEKERVMCRRVVLDEYLDGREEREGCDAGEEKCDVCGGVG